MNGNANGHANARGGTTRTSNREQHNGTTRNGKLELLVSPMRVMLRPFAYLWASPNTLLGLLLLPLAVLGGGARIVRGVVELHGPGIAWCLDRLVPIPGGAAALTLGHVVIGRTAAALDVTRDHERVHVKQYERWGPLFLPAYFGSSLAVRLRGGDAYRENRFEREAYGEARG